MLLLLNVFHVVDSAVFVVVVAVVPVVVVVVVVVESALEPSHFPSEAPRLAVVKPMAGDDLDKGLEMMDGMPDLDGDHCPAPESPTLAVPAASPSHDSLVAPEATARVRGRKVDLSLPVDPYVAVWKDPIMAVLGPYFQERGPQVAPLLVAAHCAGALSEAKIYTEFGVSVEFPWISDPLSESYWFVQSNFGHLVRHHFRCMKQMEHTGSSLCMIHGARCGVDISEMYPGRNLNCLGAGTPCLGYSTQNQYRSHGSAENHAQSGLYKEWISSIKRHQPDSAWHENVFGSLLRQSKQQPKSPLQLCLEIVEQELPQYHAVVLFLDGSTFLWFSRRRVFIHLFHRRAGGRGASKRMVALMKACVF